MIKKFEEFIGEGFMTKSLNRSKSNDRRIENKFFKSDLNVFNYGHNQTYTFLKKYDLYDWFMKDFYNLLDETYHNVMIDYAKKHGIINLGFDMDDESKLPDFEHTIKIPKLNDVSVFIKYVDDDKEITVWCGNDKPEFDIGDTTFGEIIKRTFEKLFYNIFNNDFDILKQNLKIHWDLFKELIEREVYNLTYKELEYDRRNMDTTCSSLEIIEIIPSQSKEKKLRKFCFEGVEYNGYDNGYVYFGDNFDITHTDEGIEILKIYRDSYESAKHDILQKYPYKDK